MCRSLKLTSQLTVLLNNTAEVRATFLKTFAILLLLWQRVYNEVPKYGACSSCDKYLVCFRVKLER